VPRKDVDEIYLDEILLSLPEDKAARLRCHPRRDGRGGIGGLAAWCSIGRGSDAQRAARGSWERCLRYKNELSDEKDYFEDIPSSKIQRHARSRQSTSWKPRRPVDTSKLDDATRCVKALIAAKVGRNRRRLAQPSNVINLMDACAAA